MLALFFNLISILCFSNIVVNLVKCGAFDLFSKSQEYGRVNVTIVQIVIKA